MQRSTYPRYLYTNTRNAETPSYLHLIGETKVHTEGRKDKALERLASSQTIGVLADGRHVFLVQVDQVGTVGLDARGSHGLGEDGGATSN